MEEKASWIGLAPMRALAESKESLEVWWFKLQKLSEETTGEPNAYRAWAKCALRVSQTGIEHAPRAHQMGTTHAPSLCGADEG